MDITRPPTATPSTRVDGQAVRQGGLLAEIAAGLAAGDDLDALLQRFLDPIVRLSGAHAGAVRVLSDDGGRLGLISGLGVPAGLCGSHGTVDRHCGPCGAAADGQPMVWTDNLSACANRSPNAFFDQGCRCMLTVPLQHRGRILGVYNLFFDGGEKPGPDVMSILRSAGELLGLALQQSRLEQVQLHAKLLQERQAMAAEVHDSLAQAIAFVKMRMPLLEDALRAHDETRALQFCDDVRSAASQAHASLRGLLTHLRAPMDPQGLVHALGTTAERFRRSSGAALDFVNQLPGLKLDPEQESQVFHIVQEALNNVARHAAARHARLHIGPAPRDEVEVVVEDDGAGLPSTAAQGSSHYGLEIILERARRLGGRLEVGSRTGGGTRVRLAFPLHPRSGPVAAGARP